MLFSEELNYFVTPIALDVLVEATGGPQYQIGAVAGTRFWKTEGNTGSVFVPAAFLASRTDTEPTGGRRGGGSAIFVRMVPNLQAPGGPGEVANVTVSYRLPGQTERIQQTITLTNPYAPGETPEQTWTSHAAMEKNYAIYNLYLGLHAAAAQSQDDYSCALATVEDTRDEAAAWNELRADDDISADIELLDQFAANLRQQGASADACGNPYTDPDGDGYGDGYASQSHQPDQLFSAPLPVRGAAPGQAPYLAICAKRRFMLLMLSGAPSTRTSGIAPASGG